VFRRLLVSLVAFSFLAGMAITLSDPTNEAYAQDKKEKKEKKEDSFKDQWPKVKGSVAKILKVDVDKKTAEVELNDGKKMPLLIDAKVKFFGPRGGARKDGLKDECFSEGYTCKIVFDSSGKIADEIHLAVRKGKK
jgi:hypothetical protein